MKNIRLALILALLILVVVFSGCVESPPVGEWILVPQSDAMVFHDNGTFELLSYRLDCQNILISPGGPPEISVSTGESFPNPPRYECRNIPGTGKWHLSKQGIYTTDFSKEPAWIDMVITEQGSSRRVQGLIKVLDDNTMYLVWADVRPASLDSSYTYRLTRAALNEINR